MRLVPPSPGRPERRCARSSTYDVAGTPSQMQEQDHVATSALNGALRRLGSPGPHPDYADELMLFGQFVGSWDVESTLFSPDGTRRSLRGEWHFGWVLEGRAIQDVLISPPREERTPTGPQTFEYGTTVRFYDPRTKTWQITWITPVNGEVHHLIGRQIGEEILLEGRTPDGKPERWSFSEITADAFVWRGHVSFDEGRTWFMDEEMRVRRRAPR